MCLYTYMNDNSSIHIPCTLAFNTCPSCKSYLEPLSGQGGKILKIKLTTKGQSLNLIADSTTIGNRN